MTLKMSLDEIAQTHDENPAASAESLRALGEAGVEEKDLPRFSWLVNHVIGEKLGDWRGALALHGLARSTFPPAVLRNKAAAAYFAGDLLEAWHMEALLAKSAGGSLSDARATVRLCILQHVVETAPPGSTARALRACLGDIQDLNHAGPLGVMAAASLNNVTSALLDRPGLDLDDMDQRNALTEGARLCRTIWGNAGTWINHERADYLVALCCNRVGDWSEARNASEAGLETIRANGVQDVDRAFLLLELARANQGLGRVEEAMEARGQAYALAAKFNDPGLRQWFDERAAVL